MTISEIEKMPTCVNEIPAGAKGVHESVLRGYQILQKVKHYLEQGVPVSTILDLICEMEGKCVTQ